MTYECTHDNPVHDCPSCDHDLDQCHGSLRKPELATASISKKNNVLKSGKFDLIRLLYNDLRIISY